MRIWGLMIITFRGWRRLLHDRNTLAQEASRASAAMECIASEMRLLLGTEGIRLPVIEDHLDNYYERVGRPWRR